MRRFIQQATVPAFFILVLFILSAQQAHAAFCTTSTQIVAPGNGASYTWNSAGVGFTIQVKWGLGSCSTGGAREITYYVDGNVVCDYFNGYSGQMSCAVSGLGLGSHSIKATDWNSSSTINITVNAPPTTVGLSVNSSFFNTPAAIVLTANPSTNGYGSINAVEFYNGSTLLATVGYPYTYTWNNSTPGSYSLIAKAYNSSGATATSSSININVYTVPTFVSFNNQCLAKVSSQP